MFNFLNMRVRQPHIQKLVERFEKHIDFSSLIFRTKNRAILWIIQYKGRRFTPHLPSCQLNAGSHRGRVKVAEGGQRRKVGSPLVPTWTWWSHSVATPGRVEAMHCGRLTSHTIFWNNFGFQWEVLIYWYIFRKKKKGNFFLQNALMWRSQVRSPRTLY